MMSSRLSPPSYRSVEQALKPLNVSQTLFDVFAAVALFSLFFVFMLAIISPVLILLLFFGFE